MNEHHEGFLKILAELTEIENRLKATETYKILDNISDLYLENGKVNAYIKMDEVNKEKNLTTNNYKDLIDIYFYENKLLIKNEKDKAIIDLIELFSGGFEDDALDYLEKFAYSTCDEQPYALSILLLLAKIEKRTEKTIQNIRIGFNSFDDQIKDFVINYSSALFPDKKINFVSINQNAQHNNIKHLENTFREERDQKKWWEFWK
ncbi:MULTISPECIES: hypothetical protein [Flavobacterium]|uniref:hypothetical protein n=1 Tax=Flavobacterium TaxID=237 RepID=UPI002114E5FC|nr:MULTISPECIES: hypothetical protein [Flavobacterium]UUF15005.1 hypothetical protein NLJ00_02605 [Flavobacterium panici]